MKRIGINDKYINREYSWLLFNKRVLESAKDLTNPLLERAKFLSIFTSNLDEFISVRMGSLYNQDKKTPDKRDNKSNLTSSEQIDLIYSSLPLLYKEVKETYSFIKTELLSLNINLLNSEKLKIKQEEKAHKFFDNLVLPQISAMVLGEKHPLVRFSNLKTYLIVELKKDDEVLFGLASVDSLCEDVFRLPSNNKINLITKDEILLTFADQIFTNYTILNKALIRITRNADLSLKVDKNTSFDQTIENNVKIREKGNPLRLEINRRCKKIEDFLKEALEIGDYQIFETKAPFNYNFLNRLDVYLNEDIVSALKYKPFKPSVPENIDIKKSIISQIEEKDLLLFYPYHSVDIFLKLLKEAVNDESVTHISITIYRLSKNSKILNYLLEALENNKSVTAVLELSARFDEKRNVMSAKELMDRGAVVVYGDKDLKIHSKLLSITRKVNGKIRYITHIGTGNYNESTSSIYTDLNLLTSNEEIGRDAKQFFRNITLQETNPVYEKLFTSPTTLKANFISEIEREIEKGKDGLIECKMNSLSDKDMIDYLSKAADSGVRVRLLVRGICCLLPQNENITITSIVSRFLEHSRIFKFGKEDSRVYIASSDFMTRNLERRIEVAVKIEDENVKKRVESILSTHLLDNVKAKRMDEAGTYKLIESLSTPLDSQNYFLENASKI